MAVSTKRKNSLKSKSNSKTRKQFKKFRKNGMGTQKMMRGGGNETSNNINRRIVKLLKQQQINRMYYTHTGPKKFNEAPYKDAHLKGFTGYTTAINKRRQTTYPESFRVKYSRKK